VRGGQVALSHPFIDAHSRGQSGGQESLAHRHDGGHRGEQLVAKLAAAVVVLQQWAHARGRAWVSRLGSENGLAQRSAAGIRTARHMRAVDSAVVVDW
jgi:hypothetical protein